MKIKIESTGNVVGGERLFRIYKKGLLFYSMFPDTYIWARNLDEAREEAIKAIETKVIDI